MALPGDTTPTKVKSHQEKIEKLVETFKGKVKAMKEWGRIELAHPLKKNTSSFFVHFDLELDAQTAKALKDKLKLEEQILRYLLVRKD